MLVPATDDVAKARERDRPGRRTSPDRTADQAAPFTTPASMAGETQMHPVDAYVPRVLSGLVARHRWGHCGHSLWPDQSDGCRIRSTCGL
jgi:hypothetical protein